MSIFKNFFIGECLKSLNISSVFRCEWSSVIRDNVHNLRICAPGDPQARISMVLARTLLARATLCALSRTRPRQAHWSSSVLDILLGTRYYLYT